MINHNNFQIKRTYNNPPAKGGYRVPVHHLWPKEVLIEAAQPDKWLKEIPPPPKLQRWFGHNQKKVEEFNKRYE